MFRIITSLLLCFLVCLISGCASIVSKSEYPVSINSQPSGATVIVKNKQGMEIHQATTPTVLSLGASSGFFQTASYSMEFSKDGYSPATTNLSASIDPWYIGNIIFGGLIRMLIVDPATGAMWQIDDKVYANLSQNSSRIEKEPYARIEEDEPPSIPEQGDVSSRLKQLKELRELDLLTQEEYETRRKKLVEQL